LNVRKRDYGGCEERHSERKDVATGETIADMKPGPNDVKLIILITGDELHELKRFTIDMVEAFGLDRRIEAYTGKRPILLSLGP